jgi:transposase
VLDDHRREPVAGLGDRPHQPKLRGWFASSDCCRDNVFQAMVHKRTLDALDPWLEWAGSSLVASFAKGVLKDKAAVAAALTSPWSNGPTEGQITKLKLVKRQMYGRGKLDLLHARVIGAT